MREQARQSWKDSLLAAEQQPPSLGFGSSAAVGRSEDLGLRICLLSDG